MKKVMFLMYSLECGGAQSVLINLANHLPKNEVDVTICTLFGGGDLEDRLNDAVHLESILTVKNPYLKKALSGLFQYILPQSFIYNMFFKGDYDYEIAYMEGYPVKVLSKSKNPHKIAWTHIDVEAYEKQDNLFKNLSKQKKAYEGFEKIICVSECVKDAFVRKFGLADKTEVIYNLIDGELIQKMGNAKNPYEGSDKLTYHFVTVGNIIPRKRLERLIYAAEYIKANYPGSRFQIHIVGKGADTDLWKLVIKKGLTDYIVFEGFQANPYNWIAYADCYMCVSEVEGYSTTIAESMVLGIPVISTKSAGTVEVMGTTEGFNLIDQEDKPEEEIIKCIASAMLAIMTNNTLLGQSREQSMERGNDFSVEKATENVMRLFNQ